MSGRRCRRLIGTAATLMTGVLLFVSAGAGAQAESVVIEVQDIRSCAHLATHLESSTSWRGLRLGTPRDGEFGDRHVTVEVSNFSALDFDWSAAPGLDAVLIAYDEDDQSAQIAYVYSGEASEDTAVGIAEFAPAGTITQLTFCHDPNEAAVTTSTVVETTSTDVPESSSTTASSTTSTSVTTTTLAPTTTSATPATSTPEQTTTSERQTVEALATTGANSGLLLPVGLILLGLGAAIVTALDRTNRYVHAKNRR